MIIVTSPSLPEKLSSMAALLDLKIAYRNSPESILAMKPSVIIAEAGVPAELSIMYKIREKNPSIPRILAFSAQAIPLNVMISMRVAHRFIDLSHDPSELASAIADAMRLTELFMSPQIQKCIRGLAFLPRLPGLYVQVEEAVHLPGASLAQAAAVIEKDQTVTGQVLKLVNAAAFAGNKPITKVSEAVTRIGINNLKAIILAVSIFSGKVKHGTALDFNSLHTHAFAVARCCRLIAEKEKLPVWSQDLLFLSGLLHDLGALVLITSQPALYEETLLKSLTTNNDMLTLEGETFGANHAILGGYISRLWGFPDMVSELITEHHSTRKEDISFQILRATDAATQKLLYNGRGEGIPSDGIVKDEWMRICKPVIQEILTESVEINKHK